MTILNVVSETTLTRYLTIKRKSFNMLELLHTYEEKLMESEIADEVKERMLVKFKKIITGYVPVYKAPRKKKKIHPLSNESSGLMDSTY